MIHDAGKIVPGLVVFLGLMTFPVWYNATAGKPADGPNPEMPKKEKSCVADKAYMRSFHMDLLNKWRDTVVRNGDRTHVSPDGRKFDKSLSRTCMNCHSDRAKFCAECHGYAGVNPYCWDCHVEPKLAAR